MTKTGETLVAVVENKKPLNDAFLLLVVQCVTEEQKCQLLRAKSSVTTVTSNLFNFVF